MTVYFNLTNTNKYVEQVNLIKTYALLGVFVLCQKEGVFVVQFFFVTNQFIIYVVGV